MVRVDLGLSTGTLLWALLQSLLGSMSFCFGLPEILTVARVAAPSMSIREGFMIFISWVVGRGW